MSRPSAPPSSAACGSKSRTSGANRAISARRDVGRIADDEIERTINAVERIAELKAGALGHAVSAALACATAALAHSCRCRARRQRQLGSSVTSSAPEPVPISRIRKAPLRQPFADASRARLDQRLAVGPRIEGRRRDGEARGRRTRARPVCARPARLHTAGAASLRSLRASATTCSGRAISSRRATCRVAPRQRAGAHRGRHPRSPPQLSAALHSRTARRVVPAAPASAQALRHFPCPPVGSPGAR